MHFVNGKKALQNFEGDSEALLVRGDYSTDDSGELLYSLDKARKCGELEAPGLLCGDSVEGRVEVARRQSAAVFNGCVQQCEGDGGGGNDMESGSRGSRALRLQ